MGSGIGTTGTIDHDDDWYTIFVELGKLFSQTLADNGDLTLTQFRILLEVRATGGELYARDLAARLVLDPSSVSNAINRLVKNGYIRRREASVDRRLIALSIEPAGIEAYSRAADALWESISIAWQDLNERDADIVYQNTKDVVGRLKGYTYVDVKGPIKPCYFTTVVLTEQLWSDRMNRRHRMSLTEARVLMHLRANAGTASGAEIGTALLLKPSTVSRTLSSLGELGLAVSPRDAANRRRRAVDLTDQGRTMAQTISAELAELSSSLYADVPEVMNDDVNRITKTICRTLREHRAKAIEGLTA